MTDPSGIASFRPPLNTGKRTPKDKATQQRRLIAKRNFSILRVVTRNLARTNRTLVALALALLAVFAIAGTAYAASTRHMLLPASSVPSGFKRHILRHYSLSELASEGTYSEGQLRSWGYRGGWEETFTRGLHSHHDPAQLSSNAGSYRLASGARAALATNRTACSSGPWSRIGVPQIGNQTVACSRSGDVEGHPAEVFFVIWRCGRYKGSITLSAAQDHYAVGDAVSLARRQAAHMPC